MLHSQLFRLSLAATCVCTLAAGAQPAAPQPAAAKLTPQQLETIVREISPKVEAIRGLKFKTPVGMQIIDGAAARESVKSKIDEAAIRQARYAQTAYVQLGLVPEGTDLLQNYLDMTEHDVLGYYDFREKKLFLLSHVAPADVRGTIAHELTHALDDQNFDLAALHDKTSDDDDRGTALTAVIEGSATLVMTVFSHNETGDPNTGKQARQNELNRAARVKSAPSFVQQTAMLPYLLGFSFMLHGRPWELMDGVPVKDMNEAFANPPRSTRQILHPEQYWWGRWRKEQAPVKLPDLSKALGPGWSKVLEGSIGELGLAVLTGSRLDVGSMRAFLPSSWTHAAVSGTTGDSVHHYVNGDKSVTVLLGRWESQRDATLFDRALLTRGKFFMRYGSHTLVFGGSIDTTRAQDIANAALQGLPYW